MGRRSKQTFVQRRHAAGSEAHENMLNVANYHKMQVNTTMRYHLKLAIIKKSTSKCWKREPTFSVDGDINWYSN